MSQWEAALPLVAEGLLTYQMDGKQPERTGNRDQFEAPQGVFRSSGADNQWVAISCWSDAEWRALATAIGRPDLRDDPGLATREGRKAREAELEAAISAWTAGAVRAIPRPPNYGWPVCRPSLSARPRTSLPDQELAARASGWSCRTANAREPGTSASLAVFGTPLRVRHACPCIGEHTEEVLRELLELPEAHITALREAGALA